LAGEVAIVKPQSAFFERHGARGIAVLEQVIAESRAAGALVLMDAKRGDIGSTVQAYADAYVDPASPLCSDAVTASPYLGFESLRPLIDTALAHGNGVFVLARTSNPEGGEVQQAYGADGRSVAGTILDHVRAANADTQPLGSIGCVVGATVKAANGRGPGNGGAGEVSPDLMTDESSSSAEPHRGVGEDLRINGPLLAPGVGAQGATVADLREVFEDALPLVLPSVSREILRTGPDPAALRSATRNLNDQVSELSI
jgi:orotidine-5'-phosphate decarboxylase